MSVEGSKDKLAASVTNQQPLKSWERIAILRLSYECLRDGENSMIEDRQ